MHNVQNAMFAVAMAYSFEVDLDNIRHGLRTFDSSFFEAPGRTNVFDEHSFRVILDYAHNPAAFRAIADLVSRMEVSGRRICVVAVPGDRRDEDVYEAAKILASHFDHFICKADDNRRRRGDDEIPKMLEAGLIAEGVPADAISIICDEVDAVDSALNMAEEGDLLTIFGDNSARCWKQIVYFNQENRPEQQDIPVPGTEELPEIEEIVSDGETLIRDERGVRLARSEDEGGD